MELYSQIYPENIDISGLAQPPVIIIPGLFGSTANWRGFAKKMSETQTVIVIDQRNHGRSPHADSHSYTDMVNDLLSLINAHKLERVILCGHSMGGKVAMAFALSYPERVEKLAVLDIAPVQYDHSHAPFLEALMQIDLASLTSRGEADRALQEAISDTSIRLFLLQSLSGSPGSFRWRINVPVLHAWMPEIVGFPHDDFVGERSSVPAAFIYGEESDYVLSFEERIHQYFSRARLYGVVGAGHWLHADKPEVVLNILQKFILDGEKND